MIVLQVHESINKIITSNAAPSGLNASRTIQVQKPLERVNERKVFPER